VGPVRGDLSGPELRRAALRAMRTVVANLGIDARHVVFGHTHRFGPLPHDDAGEWTAPGGARLHNSGSWIFERFLVGETAADNPGRPGPHPYWPGGVVRVDGDAVSATRLLEDRTRAELIAGPA
ncbi:MAG: hypothetical protein M3141_08790, partial [Actinomycetota bacterium]|nr:hypothetical protein [Actinomycetota bacterium]